MPLKTVIKDCKQDGRESEEEKKYFIFKSNSNLQVNNFLAVNDQTDQDLLQMAINCQEIVNLLAISALNTIRVLLFISYIHMLLFTKDMNSAETLSFNIQQSKNRAEIDG